MENEYKVAAYLRLSQEDGDKDISDSIVSQRNIIERKIQELGSNFSIEEFYIDDGYTGLNTNRPGFQKMLEDIENKKINCIITKDLSRLSRNSFEANYYIELYFLERNIRYISVLDNVDTGTKNANNDMIQFKTLINDWYSKDISRKIKSSIWARKEKGMFMGTLAPYGYKKSKKDKHKLVIEPNEARVVKRIFKEYSRGISIFEIINELKNDNIPSPNNSANMGEVRYKWRAETIKRMLENKVYLGHIEYGKRINLSYKSKKRKYIPKEEWQIIYNTHEPIVTEELFNKVQIEKNKNKTIKRKKHEWCLNGLVFCKECGAKMTLKVEYEKNNHGKIKSKKLCCLNGLKRYKGMECIRGSKGVSIDALNEIVCKSLNKILNRLDKNKIIYLIKKYADEVNNLYDIEQLNKEIMKVEKDMQVLYMDFKEKLLDEDDYKKFYKNKASEKNRIKKELELIKNKQKTNIKSDTIRTIIEKTFKMENINREIAFEIIDKIEIDNENKIYINYKYEI